MRAHCIRDRGPGGLRLEERPDPSPGPGEVLVDVYATGVNRADLLQTLGLYPAPPGVPAEIPGLEYAGRVAAVGDGVTSHRQGDRVMGLVQGGAYADKLVVAADELLPIPDRLSFTEAAALPEAFGTAFDALVLQGQMRAGDTVLVHAVGSGVGTAAAQIARASVGR
jgi:NADPH:quinone reductase